MTTNIHASTVSTSKKRRTYSDEFKNSIVQACKESNTSIASVALQYGLNANLVSNGFAFWMADKLCTLGTNHPH